MDHTTSPKKRPKRPRPKSPADDLVVHYIVRAGYAPGHDYDVDFPPGVDQESVYPLVSALGSEVVSAEVVDHAVRVRVAPTPATALIVQLWRLPR
jgi:hypothetical protein